jgi:hypothetical protein
MPCGDTKVSKKQSVSIFKAGKRVVHMQHNPEEIGNFSAVKTQNLTLNRLN